ncbi:MAG: carboxypeptidase regulatory-like domain-containing protein [Euryarchaeota archaeon]|nr:carboxypeptidase regulatory-like domain-containing protein [Euryarchaeota archaeon]
MNEFRRGTKLLLAVALCVSMVTSMLVLVPHKAGAAPPAGWIQGIVTDGVNPIENAYVIYMMYMMGGGSPLDSDWTDASGVYNFTVPGGFDYMVMAFNGSYFAANGTTTVQPGEQSNLDLTMVPIAPLVTDVTLQGWVKDADGNPVTLGNIVGIVNDPSNMGQGAPMYGNLTTANATGWYTLKVIAGSVGGGAAILDVPGFPINENTTSDPLVSGNTYWFNLTVELPASTDDATVQGNVTDSSGTPLENVLVTFESSNDPNRDRGYSNYTWTDAAGKYMMNVTNGTSNMMFSRNGFATFRLSEMSVNAGDNLWIDAELFTVTATVRGNVTDASFAPIANARVFLFDQTMNNLSLATTNVSGQYTLNAFDGADLTLMAQADGHGSNRTVITILPGDLIWHDFVLVPLDAWMHGKVTDRLNGNPIPNAGVWIHSAVYEDYKPTSATGDYNASLLSGVTYTVDVSASGYRHNTSQISIVPGGNTFDITLLPDVLPETTRLTGWVNDSSTLLGIYGATVSLGLPPPDYGTRNQTRTDATGYFEIWIPPVEMLYVANASNYAHSEGLLDATGQTDMKLMILMDPDNWNPNVTFSQSPARNISWTNVSTVHAVIQEQDPEAFSLLNAMYDQTTGTQAYYHIIEMPSDNFDPLSYPSDGLPYSQVGDVYTVDYQWSGTATGGWLTNTTDQAYYGSYEISMGPTTYDALRGYYSNSSMPGTWMAGTAWFERPTGDFLWFQYDSGDPWAQASDATGLFDSQVSMIVVNVNTGGWSWQGGSLGISSVVGLTFTYDELLPSGAYLSLFRVRDFAGHEWWTQYVTNLTVDNDIPVASAGPDQLVSGGQEVFFDGSLSSDSSGIANWTWSFTSGGTYYEVWGEHASFTFSSGDEVVIVTLTVTDGAGHTSTDTMQVTVAGVIPDFPTVLLPVMGILALFALVSVRRRFEEG